MYKDPTGQVRFEVILRKETLWMTQKKIAKLFDVSVPARSKHLKYIFESDELNEKSVVSIRETTATDGKKYQTKFFNLDAIIAVI